MTSTLLQVLPRLHTGGLERGAVDIAKHAVAEGYRAIVVSGGGRWVDELEQSGARHVHLPLYQKSPWAIRRNARALASLMDEEKVSLLHARSRAPAWCAALAIKEYSVPWITTCHGPHTLGLWGLKRYYNQVLLQANRVIAVSEFIAEYLRKNYLFDHQKLSVVPRGIDLQHYDPELVSEARCAELRKHWQLPADKKVILLPGRLTRWKGQLVLLEALRQLPAAMRENIVCVLVGAPKREGYADELSAFIRQNRLEGLVRCVGDCTDMPAAYQLAAIVISASTKPEAFGRVPVEAGAMKRLIIATAHGGACETVDPGVTGFLVPPDNPETLSSTLMDVLQLDEQQTTEIAERARERVEEYFSREAMCGAVMKIYEETLAEQAR